MGDIYRDDEGREQTVLSYGGGWHAANTANNEELLNHPLWSDYVLDVRYLSLK
jgi:hypothetical protein